MNSPDNWNLDILKYCEGALTEGSLVNPARKTSLDAIGDYIKKASEPKLIVICTHNSRRSHFGQVWLKLAADYFGIELETYSGGTEATAFHPNAVAALERCGFQIEQSGVEDPLYKLTYGDGIPAIEAFSKKFEDGANPQSGFVAVLVCDSAAEACPFVPGAEARIVLPYSDPKEFDGTDLEKEKYDERCREIAREMFYALKRIAAE